jgi:hypothetical protein
MRFILIALAAVLALSGCEFYTPAAPEEIARARYASSEPPSITLMSMVNASSGKSAHAGLLINGSERVLFDPAGTFTHPDLPRAGDVHYGMTPRFVDYYERYHARFDYFVEAQKVPVTRAEADQILADARAHGKSMKMTCALAMADVLRPVPRFADAPSSIRPEALRAYFANLPGVETHYVRDSDIGKNNAWEAGADPQG